MARPDIFDRFSPPRHPGKSFADTVSMTKQEHKDECDINRIMSRALRTGVLPGSAPVGRYGDFSQATDYQAALDTLMRAEEQFGHLPAATRDRFENDPSKFLAWIHSDAANLEEAHKLGLLSEEGNKRAIAAAAPPVVVPPVVVPPVPEKK